MMLGIWLPALIHLFFLSEVLYSGDNNLTTEFSVNRKSGRITGPRTNFAKPSF